MIQNYILTVIGDDRPGLLESLAGVVKQQNGNWLESRLANLAGKFSGIVLVAIPEAQSHSFENSILGLKDSGLSVRATRANNTQRSERHTGTMSVLANDRPGILSEVSSTLAKLGVNVEELTTDCDPAPMSGDMLFKAVAKINVPNNITDGQLVEALEELADDLIVEIDVLQESVGHVPSLC